MISVIVPIFNVAKYLRQCIESICCQTCRDLEIILVDDGSTDGSSEICDSYRKKDARIVVVHKENGGLVSARKAGLQASHGRYIAYVDGDDWIEEHMYERLYGCLVEQNVDVVMCGRYEDTGNVSKAVYHGIKQGRYDKKLMLEHVYPQMVVNMEFFKWGIFPGLWDKLFKRECIESFQMEVDEHIQMGEDAVCVYPCLLNAKSIYVLHECLYHYRQTTDSMVKQVRNCDLERDRFRVLYRSGEKAFYLNKNIYDCRKQWEIYMLFLMIPRSDSLYKGFSELDYLFPFPKVRKGMKIALYGAGTYGQRLYQYLRESRFCDIEIWVDKNYMEFQSAGLEVMSPSEIEAGSVDQIVVAIIYAEPRKALYDNLIKKYGKEKVSLIDVDLIMTSASKLALGIESHSF